MKKWLVICAMVMAIGLLPRDGTAQQSAPQFAATAPGERIQNLDALKKELKEYHACTCTCGCYAKDMNLQADRAIAFLRKRVAHRKPHEELALVLDIDETTLSNYQEMVKTDFEYNNKAFSAWVNEAAAPAIPGTLRLYKEAERLHVAVFFLTGRNEALRDGTERNLRAQGFGQWEKLILRNPQESGWTATKYKSFERAHTIEAAGYQIVLNVGDQWSDLRGTAEAEYSVKYPDPYYFIP